MPEAAVMAAGPDRTGLRVAMVAGFLASAGLPLYIHLPGFAAQLGLPLATIGALLLAIRVFDCVQIRCWGCWRNAGATGGACWRQGRWPVWGSAWGRSSWASRG